MKLRSKRLLLNNSSSFIFQFSTIICGFILPRLVLKAFGSEVNGLVNSVNQFLGVISFLELGVGAVIQSSLYKPLVDKNTNQVSKIMVSGQKFFSKLAVILLIYVLILMGVYPFIASQNFDFLYTATLIGVISISLFAQYYFGVVNRLLLVADQKGYISYNAQTITLILNTIACYILIKLGASIHLVKLTTSLIYIVRPIVLSIYVKKHYEINWKVKYDEEPIQQKWNGVAQHIAAVVLDGTDNIILTIFAGLRAVSIYSVYNLVVLGIKQLFMSTTNGIQSVIGELWAKQELENLRNFFGWVEWSLHTGVTYIFGITSILIIPFVQVYTKGVIDVNYIQPIFAFLIVAANAGHCLRLPYNIMVLAAGHYKQTQKSYIIAVVLNISISIIMVTSLGLVGVAIGTLIAMIYQTIWMAIYNSKYLLKWSLKNFIKQMSVDIMSICFLHVIIRLPIISNFFVMDGINYFYWVILAIKITLVDSLIIFVINQFFYKKYINKFVKRFLGGFKELI